MAWGNVDCASALLRMGCDPMMGDMHAQSPFLAGVWCGWAWTSSSEPEELGDSELSKAISETEWELFQTEELARSSGSGALDSTQAQRGLVVAPPAMDAMRSEATRRFITLVRVGW